VTEHAKSAGATPAEWDIPAVPIEQAQELFVTLQKALRAFQLYDENNPVYQRFVGNLRAAFRAVWDEADDLRVQVEEFRILWFDEVVYENTTRNESIAFLFFKDGIREIQFLPGIEGPEIEKFLQVLQRARNLRPEGDDLLTILWDEDLTHFQYKYVDLLAEGVELPEASTNLPDLKVAWASEVEEPGPGEETGPPAPGAPQATAAEPPKPKLATEDFNPTLYSLDPRELELLQKELEAEMKRDIRRDVLAALFDRLEEPGRFERQDKILDIFRTLLPNLLSHGALAAAAEVLAELQAVPSMGDTLGEAQIDESGRILDEISGSDAVEELVKALENGSITPSPDALGGFLGRLRPAALQPLLRASQNIEDKDTQGVLLDAVAQIGQQNQQAILRLFGSPDAAVLAGVCQLAGRMELSAAGGPMGKLMDHGEASVRLAAVEACILLKASTAVAGIEQALSDEERDIRIAAARGLADLRYQPAADKVREMLNGRAMKHADITEKIAFFEAYGALGGAEAVKVLGRLLNKKGLLGRREPDEMRACAALGLGRAGTPEAMSELRAAQNTTEPVVRSAVGRALRREFER